MSNLALYREFKQHPRCGDKYAWYMYILLTRILNFRFFGLVGSISPHHKRNRNEKTRKRKSFDPHIDPSNVLRTPQFMYFHTIEAFISSASSPFFSACKREREPSLGVSERDGFSKRGIIIISPLCCHQ